ncbi:hypothetical protein HYDPIDRAFT_41837 [Hydnomerulius pinastri MD-312]|uniref:DUF6533 domain-containing protein n=1 Tax=Hydnomerulius pinastri MD-312 TaxID=994086 RepID=A0A0C9WDS4_9AGAM|nr:hypothetical protein HYDPIDRAFT_41837 [Hydnomerulius pinastri MD-312]
MILDELPPSRSLSARNSTHMSEQALGNTEYVSFARTAQITRMCQLAPFVVMAYDHMITFDEEVSGSTKVLSQKRSWSPTKVLYLILRYGGNLYALQNAAGAQFVHDLHPPLNLICCGLTPVFLQPAFLTETSSKLYVINKYMRNLAKLLGVYMMHIYALYDKSKKVLLFLGIAYIVEIAVMSTILIFSNVAGGVTNEPFPGINICTNSLVADGFSFWVAPLTYESLLCCFAIWIGFKRSQVDTPPGLVFGTRLVDVVVKGNVLYFACVVLTMIVNTVMWSIPSLSPQWMEVPEGFAEAIGVIAGCRLVLHVRGVASPTSLDSTTAVPSQVVFEYPMQLLTCAPESDLDRA